MIGRRSFLKLVGASTATAGITILAGKIPQLPSSPPPTPQSSGTTRPAYSFVDDENVGLYRTDHDKIGFSGNATTIGWLT